MVLLACIPLYQTVTLSRLPFNTLKREGKRRFETVLPIYCMTFSDQSINQEIFDILALKIQNFHANLTEKEKITRYLKVFLQEIMHFTYQEGEKYEHVFDDGKLLAIVARIQSKIFDKTFSFNAAKIEEAQKNNLEETIYIAIEEEARKLRQLESTEELEPRIEKGMPKNNEPTNGASQKANEEDSPKRKKKGDKRENVLFSIFYNVYTSKRPSSDSEEQENSKEMEYSNKNARNIELFEPIPKDKEVFFYVRFYYSLYERFLKVKEISAEFEANHNLITRKAKVELSKERYEIFKWVLAHLIRTNIDNEKYEDLLRCVFGNKAYLMFYIDRIIHMIIITIQKLMNDDTSVKTMNFFTETELPTKNSDIPKGKVIKKKLKNWPEYVYLAQINQLTLENMNSLQSTTFFRFVFNPKDFLMTVNIYDSAYKGWNEKILDASYEYAAWYRSVHLQDNHLASSNNIVYLERNKKLTKKPKVVQSNKIELNPLTNTTKFVTDNINKEDVLQVIKKNTETIEDIIIKRIKLQYKRANRFCNKSRFGEKGP